MVALQALAEYSVRAFAMSELDLQVTIYTTPPETVLINKNNAHLLQSIDVCICIYITDLFGKIPTAWILLVSHTFE